jgi:hypothetical protein
MRLLFLCSLTVALAALAIGLAGDPEWLNVVNAAAYLGLGLSASMLLLRRLRAGPSTGRTTAV